MPTDKRASSDLSIASSEEDKLSQNASILESVSEKTVKSPTEGASTNSPASEKICVDPDRLVMAKSTESTSDTTQENTEKLQNGYALLHEDKEAKQTEVEKTVPNIKFSEDSELQKEGKEIDGVASENVKPILNSENKDNFSDESIVKDKQEIKFETASNSPEILEPVLTEVGLKEKKESTTDIQGNKIREESPMEGIKEIKKLQDDNKCEDSGLKESEGQSYEVAAGTEMSVVADANESVDDLQNQIKESSSRAQETDSVDETTDVEKVPGTAHHEPAVCISEEGKVPSEPPSVVGESSVIDSDQQLVEKCIVDTSNETEVGVPETVEGLEQKTVESDTKHGQEEGRIEENNSQHEGKVAEPEDKLQSRAEENHKNNIQIGTGLPPVSCDMQVKNKPENAVVKQPHECELPSVPNINISCAENEAEDKSTNQANVESSQHHDPESSKENDTDSGTGSAADNSSIDLNLSISSFLTKNKESGSISLQVRATRFK